MSEVIRAALLVSGHSSGSTANAVMDAWHADELNGIKPSLVISSGPNPSSLAINKAKELGIPTKVLDKKNHSGQVYVDEFMRILDFNKINIIAQLGWPVLTPKQIVAAYEGFNQHPAPLPEFGGRGMYGLAPHYAIIAFAFMTGLPIRTEATTHRIDKEYDTGDIIRRIPMDLPPSGFNHLITADELRNDEGIQQQILSSAKETQKNLLPREHANVIDTLRDFGRGNVPVYQREQPLVPPEYRQALAIAKQFAVGFIHGIK